MSEFAVELNNIHFSYEENREVLSGLNFRLRHGEFALLQGISGAGKSTLLSIINGVIPFVHPGRLSGEILLEGQDASGFSIARRARLIGSVLQNVEDQIIHDRADDEIAFGCENLGLPAEEIDRRVQAALDRTHLKADFSTRKLSGGQKQRLITAATFAMDQRTLILDEPLANLDRESAVSLLRELRSMADAGYAVLLVEHRLDMALPFADSVYTLTEGKMVPAPEKGRLLREDSGILPWDHQPISSREKLISIRDVFYSVRHVDVLMGVSMDIFAGERITILGPNGCGKTTLLKLLARLIDPSSGGYEQHLIPSRRVHAMPEWFRKAGYVYQNPSYQLFMPTLRQEVERCAVSRDRAERMIEMFGLSGLENRHPQSLSEGQKRRADVAAVCASDPRVLFLDEPTVGQDYGHLKQMLEGIRILQKESGCAVVTVTHDIRCKEALSDRRIIMKQGRILRQERGSQIRESEET